MRQRNPGCFGNIILEGSLATSKAEKSLGKCSGEEQQWNETTPEWKMNGQEGPRLQTGSREWSYANTQNVIPNRKRRNKEVFQSRVGAASKSGVKASQEAFRVPGMSKQLWEGSSTPLQHPHDTSRSALVLGPLLTPEPRNPSMDWVRREPKAGVQRQQGEPWHGSTCPPSPSPCTRGCWGAPCCRRARSGSLGTQTIHQSRASGGGTADGAPSACKQEQWAELKLCCKGAKPQLIRTACKNTGSA